MKKEKINIWQKNLRDGKRGEISLLKSLSGRIIISTNQIGWDKRKSFTIRMQRKGINGTAKTRDIQIECKTRRYYHRRDDILIETISIMETNQPGWFYTSQADLIYYAWENKNGDGFVDGYLIDIQNAKLKKWFEKNKDFYPSPKPACSIDKRTGRKWHTDNKPIPIKDFPEGTIQQCKPNEPIGGQQILELLDNKEENETTKNAKENSDKQGLEHDDQLKLPSL